MPPPPAGSVVKTPVISTPVRPTGVSGSPVAAASVKPAESADSRLEREREELLISRATKYVEGLEQEVEHRAVHMDALAHQLQEEEAKSAALRQDRDALLDYSEHLSRHNSELRIKYTDSDRFARAVHEDPFAIRELLTATAAALAANHAAPPTAASPAVLSASSVATAPPPSAVFQLPPEVQTAYDLAAVASREALPNRNGAFPGVSPSLGGGRGNPAEGSGATHSPPLPADPLSIPAPPARSVTPPLPSASPSPPPTATTGAGGGGVPPVLNLSSIPGGGATGVSTPTNTRLLELERYIESLRQQADEGAVRSHSVATGIPPPLPPPPTLYIPTPAVPGAGRASSIGTHEAGVGTEMNAHRRQALEALRAEIEMEGKRLTAERNRWSAYLQNMHVVKPPQTVG